MSVQENVLKFSYPYQCKQGDPSRLAARVYSSSGSWTDTSVPAILPCADADTYCIKHKFDKCKELVGCKSADIYNYSYSTDSNIPEVSLKDLMVFTQDKIFHALKCP